MTDPADSPSPHPTSDISQSRRGDPHPTSKDRWAHRRGEPRVFALAWTVFLFAATLITFVAAQSAGIGDRSLVRSAAQLLVFAAALGLTVLWPMARLSQAPDPRPVAGTAKDLLVLLIPLQAMLWPQAMWWLARWPLAVIGAADLLLVSWAFLVGGLLACFQAARARRARAGQQWGVAQNITAMVLIILIVATGSLAALGDGPPPLTGGDVVPPSIRPACLLSPFTAVFETTRDRAWSGITAAVSPGHILASFLTALFGLPGWLLAARVQRGPRPPAGLH